MAQSVNGLLIRAASLYPDRPAVAVGSSIIRRYGELVSRVASLAYSLRHRCGLVPGDRVALFLPNCHQYIEVLFACWHGGLIAVPVNVKLHPRELRYILSNSASKICFVTQRASGLTSGIVPEGVSIIDVASDSYERLCDHGATEPPRNGRIDDLAWLFYTSGTTGRPKGAMITHRNLLAMTFSYFADLESISATDSILHVAPMSHGSGLYMIPHIAQAALNVIPESGGFDSAEVHENLRVHRGVTLFAAPTMVQRLTDLTDEADVPGLKTLVYGGGPMYVEDCRRALDRYGYRLAQIYGQGEAPMTISVLNKQQHAENHIANNQGRLGSVGHAFMGVDINVADTDGQRLGPGETGEILVRGDVVMKGYWREKAETAKTLRSGWLHTGDIGTLDGAGFLTLKGRSKDVIISGGTNIYPREVEEVLLRHPAVSEVAVVGIPDAEWGEKVVAAVVTREEYQVSEAELDALCVENIARFKRPRHYKFVSELPKNPNGKVLKRELQMTFSREAGASHDVPHVSGIQSQETNDRAEARCEDRIDGFDEVEPDGTLT